MVYISQTIDFASYLEVSFMGECRSQCPTFDGPVNLLHILKSISLMNIILCDFFLFGYYGPSRLFHSFWAESLVRYGENGRSPKNTWPSASRTWLISHVTVAWRGSSIGSVFAWHVSWHASGPEFDPNVRHILSWGLGHENFFRAILPLLLIQEEQFSVTGERMCTKYW